MTIGKEGRASRGTGVALRGPDVKGKRPSAVAFGDP